MGLARVNITYRWSLVNPAHFEFSDIVHGNIMFEISNGFGSICVCGYYDYELIEYCFSINYIFNFFGLIS